MGWSLKGLPYKVRSSGQRSTRWSILPAMGLNGYLDYEIFHGSFNSECFLLFVQRLLRKMNRAPGPRSVLLLIVQPHTSPIISRLLATFTGSLDGTDGAARSSGFLRLLKWYAGFRLFSQLARHILIKESKRTRMYVQITQNGLTRKR